jgi:hypothetical protein
MLDDTTVEQEKMNCEKKDVSLKPGIHMVWDPNGLPV